MVCTWGTIGQPDHCWFLHLQDYHALAADALLPNSVILWIITISHHTFTFRESFQGLTNWVYLELYIISHLPHTAWTLAFTSSQPACLKLCCVIHDAYVLLYIGLNIHHSEDNFVMHNVILSFKTNLWSSSWKLFACVCLQGHIDRRVAPIIWAIYGRWLLNFLSYNKLCSNILCNKDATLKWLQENKLIANQRSCPNCLDDMKLCTTSDRHNGLKWICRKNKGTDRHRRECSIRKNSWFENSNLTIPETLKFTYWWCMGVSQRT